MYSENVYILQAQKGCFVTGLSESVYKTASPTTGDYSGGEVAPLRNPREPFLSIHQSRALLVSSAISHREQKTRQIKIYKKDVKITRNAPPPGKSKVCTPRGKIDSFSQKSRARLRFVAANSDRPLISQFCLTYHQQIPDSGQAIKKHLDIFLKFLSRQVHDFVYLWVLEFQKRGAPHFHVFLSIPPDPYFQCLMASRWRQITGESEEHERFHAHASNWIDWDMGNGSYLCKYLCKGEQKTVPEHFKDVGRFWGCSRRMVTVQAVIEESDLANQSQGAQVNPETGELEEPKSYARIVRALRRFQRAVYRRHLKGKRLRLVCGRSSLVPGGAALVPRLLEFYRPPPF